MNLDDLKIHLKPLDQEVVERPTAPLWKKILLVGIVLGVYGGLVAFFFLADGALKLLAIVLMVAFIPLSKFLILGLRKLLKFPVLPD